MHIRREEILDFVHSHALDGRSTIWVPLELSDDMHASIHSVKAMPLLTQLLISLECFIDLVAILLKPWGAFPRNFAIVCKAEVATRGLEDFVRAFNV